MVKKKWTHKDELFIRAMKLDTVCIRAHGHADLYSTILAYLHVLTCNVCTGNAACMPGMDRNKWNS
jgi:hypothetical protein